MLHLVVITTTLVTATLLAGTITALITLAIIGASLGLSLMIRAVMNPQGCRPFPVERLYPPFSQDFQDE